MASISSITPNIARISSADKELREIISLLPEGLRPDERIDTYAAKLARNAVDEPSLHTIPVGGRITAGGLQISDRISSVRKIYGDSREVDGQMTNFAAKTIVSTAADNSWESVMNIDPTTIVDEEGAMVFPNGLCASGDVCDEIDFVRGVAIKRIGPDYGVIAPVEYPLPASFNKSFYRVANGGTERITADGPTLPLKAVLAYRMANSSQNSLDAQAASQLL